MTQVIQQCPAIYCLAILPWTRLLHWSMLSSLGLGEGGRSALLTSNLWSPRHQSRQTGTQTAASPLSGSWHGMDSTVSTTCAKEGCSLQTGTGLMGRQPSPDSVWYCTIFFCPFRTRCTKCYDGNCKSLTTSRDKCIYSHKDLSSWDMVSMMLHNTSYRQLHILGLHCMHKIEEFYNSYSIPA